jgi:hypothetical protein
MIQAKVHFGIGLFIGVFLTALFFQFFASRYDVIELDKMLIKQDKWSGNSWRYEDDQWGKITDSTRDWKPVDEVLMKAINMPADGGTNRSEGQTTSLKKKYPELEKIPNEDIIKRIKYIYARKIMVDFYFSKANVK